MFIFRQVEVLLIGYDSDGNVIWERSLMEEFARLTFPNGRTGGPCVDGDLVIIHAITANWGKQGQLEIVFTLLIRKRVI